MAINKVEIRSFRGISGKLTLDTGKSVDGRPPVLLIHGDNGTGKSSIIDAFEFGLQSRLHRHAGLSNPETPYVLPLGAKEGNVKIYFEDGTSVVREVKTNEKSGNVHAIPSRSHDEYRIAPFVLRRADILSFWDTPEHERQTIFTDVSLNSSGAEAPDELFRERLAELERERTKLKSQRRRHADDLAYSLGFAAVEIPLGVKELEQFIKKHIYSGLTQQQRQQAIRRGNKVPSINYEALGHAKKVQELFEPIANYNNQIAKFSKPDTDNPRLRAVRELLKSAESELTNAFKGICTSGELIDKVEIITGHIGRVDLLFWLKL